MIDYQLPVGTKVKATRTTVSKILTKGKIYTVIDHPKGNWYDDSDFVFWFIDDAGEEMYSFPSHGEFEVVK